MTYSSYNRYMIDNHSKMVRLGFHMVFFHHVCHFIAIKHDYVVLSYVHWYTRTPISDTVISTLSPLPTHRYTEHCIAYKDLLHAIPLVDVSPFHRYRESRHYSCMFGTYWYTATLVRWIPPCYIDILVTWMHWSLLLHAQSQRYAPLGHGHTNARTTAFYIIVIIVT